MYLFVRTSTADPKRGMDALAFSADIAGRVNSVTGQEVSAWTVLYGAPITTVTWTTRVESHAALGAMTEKLQADAGYMAATAEAADLFVGAPEDSLIELLAMAGTGTGAGNYASVVTAQCADGKISDAMGWGVDILNHVHNVTGQDGSFSRSLYGPWASVGWITLANTLDEIDAANAKISADPTYIEKIDAATGLFVTGATATRLSQKIA